MKMVVMRMLKKLNQNTTNNENSFKNIKEDETDLPNCYDKPLKECFLQKTDNKAEIKEKYAYIYKIFKKEYERCLKEIGNKGEDIANTDNLGLFARFSQIHNVVRVMESNELKVKDIVFMILQLKSRFKTIAKREILIDNANINHRERYTLVKKSILEELEVLYSILFDLAQMTDLDESKQEGGDENGLLMLLLLLLLLLMLLLLLLLHAAAAGCCC